MTTLHRVEDTPRPRTTGDILAACHGGFARTVEAAGMSRSTVQTPRKV